MSLPRMNRIADSRVLSSISWTSIGFIATYAVRLLSTLFLTRLLAPEAFGLMSLVSVFLIGLGMLSDIGTLPSIIRSPRGEEAAFLDTAWSIQATRGLILGGVTALLAWPFAWIYDEPALFPLLLAMAITPMISGFASIAGALCRRRMELSRVTTQQIIVQLATTVLNILFAWWFHSVWGLVIGAIAGSLLQVAMTYLWLPPYRPRYRFEPEAMREIIHFGRWILLGTLFTYLGGQGLRGVMGLVIPVQTLGLITIAMTIAFALEDLVHRVMDQISFPAMARVFRENPHELPRIVERVKRFVLLIIQPGFLLLSLLSQPIIDLLYDPRYAEAGGYMRFLALNCAIGTLAMPYQNTLIVMGKSREHSIVMGVLAVLQVACLLIGVHLAGVYGMLAGIGLANLLAYGLSLYFARSGGFAKLWLDAVSLVCILGIYAYGWVAAFG